MESRKPLPCTAFEELMLAQDSTAYPCDIFVRMMISGKIQREHFTAAVTQMLDRNPLFRAKLQLRMGRSAWLIQPISDHPICWSIGSATSESDLSWPAAHLIDLYKHTGLYVHVHETLASGNDETQPTGAMVTFQLHHAIADGLGILSAIHELWLAYNASSQGKLPALPKRDLGALRHRNRFGLSWNKLRKIIPNQLVGLAGVQQFLMRQPVPLVPHEAWRDDKAPRLMMASRSHNFSLDQSIYLRQTANNQGISLNDLMAACVFRGCVDFRATRTNQSDQDWLRMMIPVNMRSSREDQHQSACNIVSSVFLDRTPQQLRNPQALAESIHQEMELIKSKRLALIFIFSIWLRKLLTFRKNKSNSVTRCQTTVVFSNLGKLFGRSPLLDSHKRIVAGGIVMDAFTIFAPLTPFMCVAFTTLQYADQLTLSMRFDPRIVEQVWAEDLLQRTVKYLESYALESHAT